MAMPEFRYQHLVRQDCPLPPGAEVFIYCRDSGGDEQDRSVHQQVQVATEYCLSHNLHLQAVYTDEARLSSNTEKRDGLRDMLAVLRKRFKHINDRYKRERAALEQPFGVIFWKSSRLGRDSIEATHIKTDLRLRGITLIDLVTSANTGNAALDGLIESFQQWQDEQLLNDISRDAKRGLADLVSKRDTDPEFLQYNPGWQSTGGYLGLMPGKPPLGFRGERVQIGIYRRKKSGVSGSARIVQRLVPNPDLWDRCQMAWKMRMEGAGYGEIHKATRLYKNANGYDTFFSNPIYTGDLDYAGTLYKDFVPAMISKEWFAEEQQRRAQRAERRKPKGKIRRSYEAGHVGSKLLLAGLVYCGHVEGEEHPMHGEVIPAKAGKRGTYRYFICNVAKDSRGVRCSSRRMSMRVLEDAVVNALLTHILTVETLRPVINVISANLAERTQDAETRLAANAERLAEVQRSIESILNLLEKMGYAIELQNRFDARKREEAILLSERAELEALRVTSASKPLSDEQVKQWILHLRENLERGDPVIARRMLQQIVEKIVVKNRTAALYYVPPFFDEAYMSSFHDLDLRGNVLKTRQVLDLLLDTPRATVSKMLNPDKAALRRRILELRKAGQSYRDIGTTLGIHWTRIRQIIAQ